jgi:hypothetical protein
MMREGGREGHHVSMILRGGREREGEGEGEGGRGREGIA